MTRLRGWIMRHPGTVPAALPWIALARVALPGHHYAWRTSVIEHVGDEGSILALVSHYHDELEAWPMVDRLVALPGFYETSSYVVHVRLALGGPVEEGLSAMALLTELDRKGDYSAWPHLGDV